MPVSLSATNKDFGLQQKRYLLGVILNTCVVCSKPCTQTLHCNTFRNQTQDGRREMQVADNELHRCGVRQCTLHKERLRKYQCANLSLNSYISTAGPNILEIDLGIRGMAWCQACVSRGLASGFIFSDGSARLFNGWWFGYLSSCLPQPRSMACLLNIITNTEAMAMDVDPLILGPLAPEYSDSSNKARTSVNLH